MEIKEKFIGLWRKYFDEADLPIVFYYSDDASLAKAIDRPPGLNCIVAHLSKVRGGRILCFDVSSVGCFGGRRYLGFADEIREDFEYFLSCGIPGKLEGERYKKSPELVNELMKISPKFKAPSRFIVFKRWDKLEETVNPDVVIFFTQPDVLSGLFTLANFDEAEPNGVFAPFSAGCGSIVQYPYLEKLSERPRCVLGMFDVSARPYVPENTLTFSVPINKFAKMVKNMEESFLVGSSWQKVNKRINRLERR